jgi:hypothetical protein
MCPTFIHIIIQYSQDKCIHPVPKNIQDQTPNPKPIHPFSHPFLNPYILIQDEAQGLGFRVHFIQSSNTCTGHFTTTSGCDHGMDGDWRTVP